MLKLSDALLGKYQMLLDKQGVAPRDHDNYKKWLRYYLDFCKKYQHPYIVSREALPWNGIMGSLENEIKLRHYSHKTLKSYTLWAGKFQYHTRHKSPEALSSSDVKEFLACLAAGKKVSASSQNQAFNALLFLFRQDCLMRHR